MNSKAFFSLDSIIIMVVDEPFWEFLTKLPLRTVHIPPIETVSLQLKLFFFMILSSSCHKRQKAQVPTPEAPICSRQTRKGTNAKVRDRYTNLIKPNLPKPNPYNHRPTYHFAVTNFGNCVVGACGFWHYRMHPDFIFHCYLPLRSWIQSCWLFASSDVRRYIHSCIRLWHWILGWWGRLRVKSELLGRKFGSRRKTWCEDIHEGGPT